MHLMQTTSMAIDFADIDPTLTGSKKEINSLEAFWYFYM